MNKDEAKSRIIEIEREIAALPEGSITSKKINGRTYYYHRITKNGKRREHYIDESVALELKASVSRRKELEKELRRLKPLLPDTDSQNKEFSSYIRIGDELVRYTEPVKKLKKRVCFNELRAFIHDENTEKIMILYGLRRTGKTTLMRQVIADMSDADLKRSVFIQVKSSDTLADINRDLKKLEALKYKYVFIDEVTLMRDFIDGAALFSDIFAASGMKIVLSGTDSLGFMFSEDEQLFDRCIMLHTTFIPYKEFENVLGISGIDEYIRYGGTMSIGGRNYNSDSAFATEDKASSYIDSAIAKNIQHSLKFCGGGRFGNLYELYSANELTSAINRVVEDMNHRFTVDTLMRTFVSNDLSLSAANLRRDKNAPNDILDRIDSDTVTEKIKTALEILNAEEQKSRISRAHADEIKEYLKLLDLVSDIDVVRLPSNRKADALEIIAQPGMRYVQAEALVTGLLADNVFSSLDITEKTNVLSRIRNEIKGRMTEEIILLETKLAKPDKYVFKAMFAVGEFDMVVFDKNALSCEIYEIKHSETAVPEQYRHLADKEKCAVVERFYGKITGKYVIYRGKPFECGDITYLNAEEYLKAL